MAQAIELVITGGLLVTPSGIVRADLAINHGLIVAVGDVSDYRPANQIDAKNLVVMPGVIDTHVHFREPGFPEKEDMASGSRAAALGGVTTVFDMPNTKPSTTTVALLQDKFERAKQRFFVDYGFYIGATPNNTAELVAAEGLPGCAGIKLFMGSSTGDLLVAEDAEIEPIMRATRGTLAVHAEDESRLNANKKDVLESAAAKGECGVHLHPCYRDVETAYRATKRLIDLARKLNRRVHVLHVTSAEELPLLAANKDLVSCEVLPQHLALSAPSCYDKLGTLAQMNPPIRDAEHGRALWAAIRNGLIDTVGSDHAPHTLAEKGQAYPASPSGMPGVQTMLPILLDAVNAGSLTLERLVDLTSAGPARVYGIKRKGRIAVGFDADLVLVDLKKRQTIRNQWIASTCGWTPFDGMEITGWPVMTILRGMPIMQDDELLGSAVGQPVRFQKEEVMG
jgi:dihydroorotase